MSGLAEERSTVNFGCDVLYSFCLPASVLGALGGLLLLCYGLALWEWPFLLFAHCHGKKNAILLHLVGSEG